MRRAALASALLAAVSVQTPGCSERDLGDVRGTDGATTGAVPCDAAMCSSLASAYGAAVNQALRCSPQGDNECLTTALAGVRCLNDPCVVWVTPSDELQQARARWTAAACAGCQERCARTACLYPAVEPAAVTVGACTGSAPTGPGGPLAPPGGAGAPPGIPICANAARP